MKKSSWLTILMVLVLALGCLGAAKADLIPPHGEGQMGIQAVVVYNGQPIYSEPDEASKAVRTLDAGSVIILVNRQGDWAECLLSDTLDEARAGWVNTENMAVDPAWFMTSGDTLVYAWNDTKAFITATVEKDTLIPVLKQDGEWLLVSLGNGVIGWILNDAA